MGHPAPYTAPHSGLSSGTTLPPRVVTRCPTAAGLGQAPALLSTAPPPQDADPTEPGKAKGELRNYTVSAAAPGPAAPGWVLGVPVQEAGCGGVQ